MLAQAVPDYLGVQQAYAVTQRAQLARPVVGAAASFHGDQAVRVVGKMFAYFASLDLHVADLASTHIHGAPLKHALGYIQADNLLAR